MHKWTQIHYSQHLSNMELLERTWPIYMFETNHKAQGKEDTRGFHTACSKAGKCTTRNQEF
ncbi:hypothetical protein IC582_021619 [Cucumis melo]